MYREVKDYQITMFLLLKDLKDYMLFKKMETLTIQTLTKNFVHKNFL